MKKFINGLTLTIIGRTQVIPIRVLLKLGIQVTKYVYFMAYTKEMQEVRKATTPKQIWVSFERLPGRILRSSYAYSDGKPLIRLNNVNTIAAKAEKDKKKTFVIMMNHISKIYFTTG